MEILDRQFYYVNSMKCKDDKIEFNPDGKTGTGIGKYSRYLCYSLEYGIEQEIKNFCIWWLAYPDKRATLQEQSMKNVYIKQFSRDWLAPIKLIRPYPEKSISLIYFIIRYVPDIINEYISRYNLMDKTISNFVFLALLEKKRDWKTSCAICLAKQIIGTTCSCGHTEVVVFRPCGHAMCGNPCFVEFITRKHINLDPRKYFTKDGVTFVAPTSIKYEMDLSGKDIKCPICNGLIESTFQAEEIKCDISEDLIIKCRNKVMEKIR